MARSEHAIVKKCLSQLRESSQGQLLYLELIAASKEIMSQMRLAWKEHRDTETSVSESNSLEVLRIVKRIEVLVPELGSVWSAKNTISIAMEMDGLE